MTEPGKKKASRFKNRIALRLSIYILIFSSVITLVATSYHLYLEYLDDLNFIENSMDQIKTSHLPGILYSLWVSDSEDIEIELASILDLPDMHHIQIIKNNKVLYSFGTPQTDHILSRQFPLDYAFKGKSINLGTLHVVASLNGVYKRLYNEAFVILTTHAIQIFLVSFFLLFLFYYLVGKHLFVMAQYADTFNLDHLDRPLVISRRENKKGSPDELATVVDAINCMRINLKNDIADRYKLEKELKKNKMLLDAIIANATDAIFLKDLAGRYTHANKAAFQTIGKPKEELIGKNYNELFSQDEAQRVNKADSRVIEFGETLLTEEIRETDDGQTFWLVSKSPFYDKNQNIAGLIGISRNITELKKNEEEKSKLEAQLQHSQKMEAIGTLAGGIAHDFNNILTAIIGYTEMAKENTLEGIKIIDDLDEVLKASDRAKELVKQILAFSRQDQQERKPLHVHLLVEEALKLLRASIPATIEICENIDTNCGSVLADPTQIHQVIMNLCTNAYHAMRETGGVLTVELAQIEIENGDDKVTTFSLAPGQYIMLKVSDTGHGMPRAILDRIFEPYFTTKGKGEGTGMGLAVTHGIVKSFGGHITVYSEPEQGTSFNVYLPRIVLTSTSSEIKDNNNVLTGNERILVIDDEESIVKIEQKILERLGYKVTAMVSSEKALQTFSSQPDQFDLIITDMTMPQMTGAELSRKILAIRPDIPIILCTGFSELINEDKAKAFGIRAFFMKPIVGKELAKVIRNVLEKETS